VPALLSGCYELSWEKCADLPSPMYGASAVLHKEKVYVMGGYAPQREGYHSVFSYNIATNNWNKLPHSGQYQGRLQIISDKLTVIGGCDNATKKVTNKVSTFNNNSKNWTNYYPNMIKARSNPGVTTHEDHVIVLGGGLGGSDDIEILKLSQPFQWITCNITLPKPMWDISTITSDDQLYIVGYSTADGRSSKAYQVAVDSIISSIGQPPTSGQSVNWIKLPNAPHYRTAFLPHSYPPVIIGGDDSQSVPTSDVAILDITKKTWYKVASLSTARTSVAVVPISSKSILVIGGYTGGKDVAAAMEHSITTVEKGTVTLSHTVATMPTQDSTCIIQ